MKKIMFAFLLLLLAACSNTETAVPAPQPSTETPTQNVDSDNGTNVENTPVTQQSDATLTDEEAMTIIQNLIDNLKDATQNTGDETTIEAIQEAWAPYMTTAYLNEASESLDCAFEYCGAYYQIPNSVAFGWKRTFDFVSNDTFTTVAFVPNIGDSVALYSMLQSLEVKKEDGAWKINSVEFEPQDMHLSNDEVIPYLAQIYGVHIDDFYEDTLENGEFQHYIYVFTHPEYNEEYFVDGYTGTMYGRAFFEEFMNPYTE